MKLHNITVMKQCCSVMKLAVCLQIAWEGDVGPRYETTWAALAAAAAAAPFLCHSQLCTAVLACAREEECTCQRIRDEPIHIARPSTPLSGKICTHWCANTALISILLANEPPVFSLSPEQLLSTHVYTLKPAAERHRNVRYWTTSSLCTVLMLVSQNIASFHNKTLLNNCSCHFIVSCQPGNPSFLYLDNEQ